MDFFSLSFPKEIIQSKVLSKNNTIIFSAIGVTMFILTLTAYILQNMWLDDEDLPVENSSLHQRLKDIATSILSIHIIVGALVFVDTWWFSGKSIPLQSLIIGGGSLNTFLQTGLYTVSISFSSHYLFTYTLAALALACFSNAMMLALLFAMFHTGVETDPTANRGITKKVGSLQF